MFKLCPLPPPYHPYFSFNSNTAMDAKVFGMLLKPVLLRFRITQDFCTKDLTRKNVMLNMGENIFLAMSSNTQTHAYGLQFF